jgi:hypothetical protein
MALRVAVIGAGMASRAHAAAYRVAPSVYRSTLPDLTSRSAVSRMRPDEPRTNLGGDEWANEWPKDAAWDFVALGRSHDVVYWSTWLAALHAVDPDMLVNIEHEDTSLGRIGGLEVASQVLLDAARRAGITPSPSGDHTSEPSADGAPVVTADVP